MMEPNSSRILRKSHSFKKIRRNSLNWKLEQTWKLYSFIEHAVPAVLKQWIATNCKTKPSNAENSIVNKYLARIENYETKKRGRGQYYT